MNRYKITGVDTRGKRFKAIKTDNWRYAFGINLWNGSVWEHNGTKWTRIKRVLG